MSRKATPIEPAPLPLPAVGGSYIRDRAGNLIAVDEDGQPIPTEPAPVELPAPGIPEN